MLNSLDSLTLVSKTKTDLSVPKNVLCKINFPADQDTSNNTIINTFAAGYERNDILISEIMYNPNDGEPEWFEIYNNSSVDINLKNPLEVYVLVKGEKIHFSSQVNMLLLQPIRIPILFIRRPIFTNRNSVHSEILPTVLHSTISGEF